MTISGGRTPSVEMSGATSRATEDLGELRRRKFVFPQSYEPGDEAAPLTVAQLDYVRMLYTGPLDPTGEALSVGYAPGSEAGWAGVHFGETAGSRSSLTDYLTSLFRNLGCQDSARAPASFRLAQDSERTDAAFADTINATDPDLLRFADAGGKLILWHGWSDPLVPPGFMLRYYELDAAESQRQLEHGFEERAHP